MALTLALAGTATLANAQVGVSIGISQPGIYGRINVGDYPRPEVVRAQPVVVVPQAYVEQRQPIYLYVPVAHQQNWSRYCNRYGACQQPVYFVQEQWVRDRYEHEHPGWERGRGQSQNHREWRQNDERHRDHGRHGDDHDRDDGDRGGDRHGR